MKRSLMAAVLAGVAAAGAAETAPSLLGPRVLIEKAQATSGTETAPTNSPAVQARVELRRDLKAFEQASAKLPPTAAASAWLDLLDRFWALPVSLEDDRFGRASFNPFDDNSPGEETGQDEAEAAQRPLAIREVLKVLPGPAAWTDLNALVNQRKAEGDRAVREGALKVLASFLDGAPARVDEAIKQFEQTLRANRTGGPYGRNHAETEELRQAWRETKGFESPADVVRQFREALEMKNEEEQERRSITIPPLLDLTTAREADDLLLKSLLKPGIRLRGNGRGRTLDRMKVLALENIADLPAPPWWLVTEPDDAALFEAIEKRFPRPKKSEVEAEANPFSDPRYDRDDGGRREAERLYGIALLKAGRVDEAFKRQEGGGVEEEEDDWQGLFNSYGRYDLVASLAPTTDDAVRLFKALHPYALRKPERFPWALWMNLGLMVGQDDVVVKTLTEATNNSGQPTRVRVMLLNALSAACLASDRVDEAVATLRRQSALDVSQLPPDERRNLFWQQDTAQTFLRLGRLLGRRELFEEGVRLSAGKASDDSDLYGGFEHLRASSVLGELIRAGRYMEAEQTLLRVLTRIFQSARAERSSYSNPVRDQMGEVMGNLLRLYEKAGQPAEALWLLDESPWWPTADLADTEEVIPLAARVLVRAGRQMEAEGLLKRYLREHPADDEGYEALVALGGTNLVGWLDGLYARDRFEERPLIWKAVALQQAGRLDEAEQAVRQALKVDPTDGEQTAGQRVKAYAVLGDILDAQHKTNDAAFFRDVVRSVRIAEEGDAFFEAGLIARSLKKYEEAAVLFADAYCVQWRLAERLWAMGKFEEANKHYAIAFERMPEQFGQVASFCFGCQGVFEKEQSRSVAERVLTRLADSQNQRPQVHFLLGQLREAQNRDADAYRSFKRAVELDPDYLDAWSRLHEMVETLYLPKKERDGIVFRGMELDPSQRHFSGEWRTVSDIRRFWDLAMRGMRSEEPAGKGFELKGTARAIANEQAESAGSRDAMRSRILYRRYRGDRAAGAPPAILLMQHKMIEALSPYLQ